MKTENVDLFRCDVVKYDLPDATIQYHPKIFPLRKKYFSY